MEASSVIVIFLFSALASFVQRVSGFGYGIIIMTVLPFLMPSYGEATALSGLLASVTALVPAVRMYRKVPWKKMVPILITFIVVSFFAVGLVTRVDSLALKKVLGAVLIAVSLYFFFISEKIHLRPTVPVQVGMGTLSGMMGGLFAMQGPPAVIYFISSASDKDEYIAMTQWYFLIGNLTMSAFRAGHGLVTREVGIAWCLAVPAIFIGLMLGSAVYGKIRIDRLRKLVYIFLAAAGVLSLLS